MIPKYLIKMKVTWQHPIVRYQHHGVWLQKSAKTLWASRTPLVCVFGYWIKHSISYKYWDETKDIAAYILICFLSKRTIIIMLRISVRSSIATTVIPQKLPSICFSGSVNNFTSFSTISLFKNVTKMTYFGLPGSSQISHWCLLFTKILGIIVDDFTNWVHIFRKPNICQIYNQNWKAVLKHCQCVLLWHFDGSSFSSLLDRKDKKSNNRVQ